MTAPGAASFRCPQCGRVYGDPLYHGPAPHAPWNLCFDCWSSAWDEVETRIFRDRDWTVIDEALWLVCQGLTRAQAADLIGRHRRPLAHWIRLLRKFPHRAPAWLGRARSPLRSALRARRAAARSAMRCSRAYAESAR